MAQEVVMPQMGESIAEGTVVRWMKKPGDPVKRDEPLFEISTDKVDTEIPSPAEGILAEIKVRAGETVPVNTVVCIIAGPGEERSIAGAEMQRGAPPFRTAAPPPPRAAERPAPAAPPPPAAEAWGAEDEGPHRSSPLVRKIAQEHGIDISNVKGTGTGGRVTKKDILDHISQGGASEAALEAPAAPPALAPEVWDASGVRVEPLSIMRSKIAEHMVMSRRTSAHVTTFHEVDLTEVARAREARKESFQRETGVKLTLLPFVLKAAVGVLREFPVVNASLAGKDIHYHRHVHLGIAVALDDGLIVPVIRDAEDKSVLGLARAVQDLAERARTKRLTPEEVQGGTFTVTNFGSFGAVFATPIINQPQVAVLGVGAAVKRPVVLPDTDAIAVRTMMVLGLTFDHRLIDGATADRYLSRVRQVLEGGPLPLS